MIDNSNTTNSINVAKTKPDRVISIDALRGFDMFWIIGGGAVLTSLDRVFHSSTTGFIRTQLGHVPWQGFHFEDLIMPLFLFIVGVVMPFSFDRRLEHNQGKFKLYAHIIKRVIILFVLGMVAQGRLLAYDLSKLHIYCNTLQSIAAGYLISSIIILHFKPATQVIITAGLLLLYWGLLMLVPVPGYGAGVLTPEGNLAMYIDKVILASFRDGTHYTWILSSITFAATTMLGCLSGQWLKSQRSGYRKTAGLMATGAMLWALGYIWGFRFPIIKHIWTSSMVLFAGGISMLLLGLFYLIVDVWGFKKWAYGFIVIGSNAIAVYMATELFWFGNISNIFLNGLDKWLGPWQSFVHNLGAFVVVWLILWCMYRKKIFIKI